MHTPVHMHFRASMHPVHAHEGQRRMPSHLITPPISLRQGLFLNMNFFFPFFWLD